MSTPPPTPAPAPPAIEHDALPLGTRFGEFEILRVVGVGGFGIVYLAQDHSLERQATRVTTRFANAVALANRTPDGQLSTRLTDLAGNDMVTLRVHHVDAENDSLEFALADEPGAPARHAARRPGLRPTLDWSNEQAYSLWQDRNAVDRSAFEWQAPWRGGFCRSSRWTGEPCRERRWWRDLEPDRRPSWRECDALHG